MASTIVYRATVAEGNREKWTLSMWFKWDWKAGSSYDRLYDAGGDTDILKFNESDSTISWYSGIYYKTTSMAFRDPAAWYHLVCRYDSTAASGLAAANRMRMYVNGDEVTALTASNNPPEAFETATNNTGVDMVFGGASVSDQNFNGSMSHIHMCDGYSYAPTEFGETDSTSGIWKIKTGPSVTYGTNGFFLKMEDRTNLDLDSGTNAFTFTTSGTPTATYDNPSNNFCTLNSLDNYYPAMTFTNGNNTITTTGSKAYATGTFGLSAGLWYWEVKPTAQAGGNYSFIGIADVPATGTTTNYSLGYTSTTWCYFSSDGGYRNSNVTTSYGDSYTTDDIIGVYLDLTANKLYFSKNGVIQNSGTGISITAPASLTNGQYFPATNYWDAGVATYQHNFGNGYLGTSLISSPEDDAGGIGAFKYDPSTGTFDSASKDFRAICTKNIKAYGG